MTDIDTDPARTVTNSGETRYVVLLRDGAGWIEVHDGPWKASSPTGAIRKAAHDSDTDDANGNMGVYVAVPARSWKPVTVKAEQTTVLKIEEAK